MKNRKESRHAYYISHKEDELRKQKKYRSENAGKIEAHENSPNRIQYLKRYREKHQTYQTKYQRQYIHNRRKTVINFYLKDRLRSRLYYALKRNQKTGSAVRDLGCTITEFKKYLESKFQSGMTWDNRGKGWHIDHIIPLTHFNLQDRQQLLVACHYTNLQPLWAIDNIVKGNRQYSERK